MSFPTLKSLQSLSDDAWAKQPDNVELQFILGRPIMAIGAKVNSVEMLVAAPSLASTDFRRF
jgi:hypothetical protein